MSKLDDTFLYDASIFLMRENLNRRSPVRKATLIVINFGVQHVNVNIMPGLKLCGKYLKAVSAVDKTPCKFIKKRRRILIAEHIRKI